MSHPHSSPVRIIQTARIVPNNEHAILTNKDITALEMLRFSCFRGFLLHYHYHHPRPKWGHLPLLHSLPRRQYAPGLYVTPVPEELDDFES